MELMFLISIAIILITIFIIIFLALMSPILFKMAMRNLVKRKRSTVLAIGGLLVSAAIISGALAVGDSMENAVVQSAYANLGEVDIAVQSYKSFDISIYKALKNDILLNQNIDSIAPLIMLPASATHTINKFRESSTSIIGFNNDFMQLGHFIAQDGSTYTDELFGNEAIINERLAENINAASGDTITLAFRSPEYSIETVYSQLVKLTQHDFVVKEIVKNENLGRFQLGARSIISNNIFVNMTYLQSVLEMDSRINTILVSNEGNIEEGVKLTNEVSQRIEKKLNNELGFVDLGFNISAVDGYVKIEHKDIFFQEKYLDVVESASISSDYIDAVSPLTTYFVNTIISGNESIYYSIVTGFNSQKDIPFGFFTDNITGENISGEIGNNEIIITNYVAERMNISVGSTIALNYSIYDNTYREKFEFENFTVKYVVNISGKADDEELMPPFPGIKGTLSCEDWDPPIESYNRDLMEMEDLYYWQDYHGTPKAYITLDKAQEMWTNDLGNLTTIKVKPTTDTSTSLLAIYLGEQLDAAIGFGDAGISVNNIKQASIESASGVQILTETFIAFGAVVVIAGMVLIVMLVGALVEERKREIGTMRAVGSKRGQVARLFVFEGSIISLIASIIGMITGIAVAFICIFLTNTYWSNIVEGNDISLHFTYTTLAIGLAAGFLIALITFALASYAASGLRIVEALREIRTAGAKKKRITAPIALIVLGALNIIFFLVFDFGDYINPLTGLLGPALILLALPFLVRSHTRAGIVVSATTTIIYAILFAIFYPATIASSFVLFFLCGFILVAACVIAVTLNLSSIANATRLILSKLKGKTSVVMVALLNPIRRVGRTAMSIALFAIVIFTLVALSANISGQQSNLENAVKEQGGGYDVIGETSVALRFDLGNYSARIKEGLTTFPNGTDVVQFQTFGALGGTCTNLNKDAPPRLIAANESFIQENELKFSSALDYDANEPDLIWSDLDKIREDGAIPVIGELNTVVWILQKNLGDYIEIVDELGETRRLVIVGITQNSIFPGSVFISEGNLNSLYPTKAEYNLFLFKTPETNELVTYLETSLSSYGMDARDIQEVVEENLAVEWSYMSLFQALLVFGLFVGTAALALRTTKAVVERRKEIGILRALGFTKRMVLKTFLLESMYIAVLGLIISIFAGLVVSIIFFGPTVGYGAIVPWLAIIIITLVVIIASLIATAVPSLKAARMKPVEALRIEE